MVVFLAIVAMVCFVQTSMQTRAHHLAHAMMHFHAGSTGQGQIKQGKDRGDKALHKAQN